MVNRWLLRFNCVKRKFCPKIKSQSSSLKGCIFTKPEPDHHYVCRCPKPTGAYQLTDIMFTYGFFLHAYGFYKGLFWSYLIGGKHMFKSYAGMFRRNLQFWADFLKYWTKHYFANSISYAYSLVLTLPSLSEVHAQSKTKTSKMAAHIITGNYGYTNQDLCRIPGHATHAKVGLSRTWAEAGRPELKCTWQIQPRHTFSNTSHNTHFPIFNSSVGWVGNLMFQDCLCRQSPLSIVIRMYHPLKTIKFPSILCMNWWSAAGGEILWYAIELMKLTDKIDKINVRGKFSIQEPS